MYEGYAPGGVAVLVECLTDNRNRAASDVRVAFTRNGGSLADPGSVSYLFSRRGVVIVPKNDGLTEDDVLTAVLDAGAEEVNDLGEAFEVLGEASDVVAVRTAGSASCPRPTGCPRPTSARRAWTRAPSASTTSARRSRC